MSRIETGYQHKPRCTKEIFTEEGHQRIKSIHFDALSGNDIMQASEVQIWNSGIYCTGMKPVPNGLMDHRLGPANKHLNCATCHGSFTDCPGHFGYLKLACPVYNVGYFNSILNILKCVCKECGRILLSDKDRSDFLLKMRNPRADAHHKNMIMKNVRDKCIKNLRCTRCQHVNGVVTKGKSHLAITELFKTVDERVEKIQAALSHLKENTSFQSTRHLSAGDVFYLFKMMPDEDCELLNLLVRPENLIVTDIAIPPASIRPSVLVGSGQSSEDGLTVILKDIINRNAILREDLARPECIWTACWEVLQRHCVAYINSEAPSGQDSESSGLVQRLKGKHGRFRRNLLGKPVEFTGRTVISPDPNLKITEVAIPILMARVLTYPERVTHHNIEKLRRCVRNGPLKHPGANFVTLLDGTRVNLKFIEKQIVANELKCDYVVERHLEDGDIVLFNRQPSLHRMSIMSHRARIMPGRTLRFNESVCNPYNADFDGDEMNLHVPQTEEARTEAFMLMGVQNNLCTPKNGEILVASTQDFLTSSFLITRKDTFYDRAAFALFCSYIGDAMEHIDLPTPALIKPIELWSGKQLFSVLVRPNAQTRVFVNLTVKEKIHVKDTETMCPHDGYVYFRNSDLICGQLGKVTLGHGNKNGIFSVLLRDYNSDVAASCMNRLAKLSARWVGDHGFSIGIDDVQPGERLNQQKKMMIADGYKRCSAYIELFEKRKLTLRPGASAGETLEVETTEVLSEIRKKAGDVCMKELHWRNSPLIMSQCGSKGSAINITQMIACVGQQSVGGRRAPNGFIDRTLPHFPLKSKTPAAKGFVANSFYTGLTATEFFFNTMGGREGLVDTAVKTTETGYMSRRLMKSLEDLSISYDQTVRSATRETVQFIYGGDGMDPAKTEGENGIPINLDQLYNRVLATYPCKPHDSLSPIAARELVKEMISMYDMSPDGGCSSAFRDLLVEFLQERVDKLEETRIRLGIQDADPDDESYHMEIVAAKIAGIYATQLRVFLEMCISRYHKNKIEAGAAVGSIGAQSIGEPLTQMTSKTFHFAGVASMNVTLGVPRIKEIINASKNISTPLITATLDCNDEEESARLVKGEIEKTVLGEVAKTVKIVLKSSAIQPYISIVLDKERLKALHMEGSFDSIKDSIWSHPKLKVKPEHISIRSSGNLRIYLPGADRNKLLFELHSLKSLLPNVIVKGISTIDRAVINCQNGKYNLLVEGTNLLAVMGTPGVVACKTKSNHIMEIWQTLGIEAARRSIITELQDTMRSHEMSIDTRHLMLLADVMTYKGEVLGITRFVKDSVLTLASFEKTSEHLFNASVNGRDDQIQGVSECIIMGIPMQLGTGIFKVRQRVDQLTELKYGPDPIIR